MAHAGLLEHFGPSLGRPRVVTLNDSAKDDATGKTSTLEDDTPNREYETYVH